MARLTGKKNITKHLISAVLLLGLAALFLQNNYGIFSYTKEEKKPDSVDERPSGQSAGPDSIGAADSEENKSMGEAMIPSHDRADMQDESTVVSRSFSPMASGEVDSLFSLTLAPVSCGVLNRPSMRLSVTVKLFFTDDEVGKEILLHRKGLAVIVKKVFSQTSLENIVIDRMKPALLLEINKLIASGSIEDLMFEELHPIH